MLETENISKIKCRNGLERVDAKIKRVNAELKALKELRAEFRALAIKKGWATETITVSLVNAYNRTLKVFSWFA
tara:strand:+ start:512 stop:733 length:222 start_codon:yes stop_codon:yes gene_type:complete